MGEHDPFDLDLQEETRDKRRVATMLASENDDSDFVWLMKGPRGRRIVRRLLERSGVNGPCFSTNAMHMAHREGMKDVGYWILERLNKLCPTGLQTMMQEKRQNV